MQYWRISPLSPFVLVQKIYENDDVTLDCTAWLVLQGSQKVLEYLNIVLMDSDLNIITNYYFNGFHEDEIVSSTLEMGEKTFNYLMLYCNISLDILPTKKTDEGKKRCVLYPLPKLLCNVNGLPFRLGCCSYMQIAPFFIYSTV